MRRAYKQEPWLGQLLGYIDQQQKLNGFPPFDVKAFGENETRISVAVAGFAREELSVEVEERDLVISGKKADKADEGRFLHRGIAARDFSRKFHLTDGWEVKGADHQNGILTLSLRRKEPEKGSVQKIDINAKA